jgi:transcriptional regulator with XRE-family HTH domain
MNFLKDLIGRRLKELDLSQAELARRAGLNAQFVSDLMTGKKYRIRSEYVFALALALEVAPLVLLRGLGLLSETSDFEAYRNELPNELAQSLNITDWRGDPNQLPIVRGPFRRSLGAVEGRLESSYPSLFNPIADEPDCYAITSKQLDNQNTPILAPGELLLIAPKRAVSTSRHFLGYVATGRTTLSPWLFTYLGRTREYYELGLSVGRVRLPSPSLVLAHAVAGVLDGFLTQLNRRPRGS